MAQLVPEISQNVENKRSKNFDKAASSPKNTRSLAVAKLTVIIMFLYAGVKIVAKQSTTDAFAFAFHGSPRCPHSLSPALAWPDFRPIGPGLAEPGRLVWFVV